MSDENTMTPFDAMAIIEGFDGQEHDQQEWLAAWQYLIDTGIVWQLQGWYGRTARDLIEAGEVTPAGA